MSTAISQATAARPWPDEVRRRLLVALGLTSSVLNTNDLWRTYLGRLGYTGVLAAMLRRYAPSQPNGWEGLLLPSVGVSLSESAPDGQVAVPYSYTFTATGGTAPYTYAVTAGALPDGLSLAAGGALTGTPTVANTFAFTVTATDAAGVTAPVAVSITIIP